VYNASNNEFVRTNTLVKNSIVQIDATPFRQWYEQHYGVPVVKKTVKKGADATAAAAPETKKSRSVLAKLKGRQEHKEVEAHIEDQFTTGRLYACISSRPGQSGRADGYIIEGKELDFYLKKMQKKKEKKEKGTA
jgi:small subunit ribosomal protein S8e